MKKTSILALLVLSALLFASCKNHDVSAGRKDKLEGITNEIVLEWNTIVLEAAGGVTYPDPLAVSRINAITHIAIHDALNSIVPVFETYAYKGNEREADPIAAVATAAHTVLVNQLPDKKDFLDQQLEKYLSKVKDNAAKAKGITLGMAAADAILQQRKNDQISISPMGPINNPLLPGIYQPIPPTNFVFAPHWVDMKLFALEKKDQFRSAPLIPLTDKVYTKDFNEVKEYGRADSKVRTADQTAYAKYWYEFSEMGWNRVAKTVATDKKLNLLATARLFALINMALADSYTAGWDSKFYYNFWRPWTAIHAADTDGNEETTVDSSWESLMPTPPVHDYPSTHSVLGNAGATVLARLLGDNTSFTMFSSTADPAQPTRSFTSFSQAADENANSRVMAGIHFRFSCKAGQEMGNKIGNFTVDNHLRPLSYTKD